MNKQDRMRKWKNLCEKRNKKNRAIQHKKGKGFVSGG